MKQDRLVELVSLELQALALNQPKAPIIIAVSGGPDSLALLYALAQLRKRFGLQLYIAHLNHQLRGAEAAAEAEFVAEQAAALDLPISIVAQDVAGFAETERLNLYAAGRIARYRLFARLAAIIDAAAVAVAHHANDQAETLLMHLLRGTGSAGLAGMQPATPWSEWQAYCDLAAEEQPTSQPILIRPLLRATRAEIEAFCVQHGLNPRRDPANQDQRHLRSRIRYQLLPTLIEYNPAMINTLCRTAETIAAERDFLNQAVDGYWPALVQQRPGGVDLDLNVWAQLHLALQRIVIRRVYRLVGGSDTLGFDDLERVVAVAQPGIGRGVGRVIELPGGVVVRVGYHALHIGTVPLIAGPQLPIELVAEQQLPVPGIIELANGWRIVTGFGIVPAITHTGWEAWFSRVAVSQLSVRRRRSGDHFDQYERSIQSMLINAKIPKELRHDWPIVTQAERIVWVPMARAIAKPAVGSEAIWVRVEPPTAIN